jgi:ribonuclease G
MVDRVVRYKEKEPLLEAFGAEQEIRSTLSRRVDLPSGGYLIFDYAEAFTVIDVNTGRFVGSRAKKGGAGRLEDTITKNNLEAVKEVVRQLRLRDVGGIIVIDFIDMANPKNRAQVEEALRTELERDRTKTYVVEISPLGLVEMTRQNVTDGPREVMTRKCPTCGGDGIVVSDGTTAVEIERKLRALVTPGSRAKAFKIELNARIASIVAGPGGARVRELEELTKRRFFLVGIEDVHLDHFRVLDRGDVARLEPKAPVEVGQELELKLGEVGLHDPHAGVGKVKNFDVVVAGAATLVGKKLKVRIGAVEEDVAYAEPVGRADAESPITAEAEAEKPTRARKKKTVEEEPEAEAAVEVEAGAEAEEAAEPAPAKKKTRRGTRGGRSRKKKTATATPAESANGDQLVAEQAEAPPPVIHLPSRELEAEAAENGDEPAPPRKRPTRRGSRGGRNRKKKTASAASAAAAAVEAEGEQSGGEDEWKYTPISDWGDE